MYYHITLPYKSAQTGITFKERIFKRDTHDAIREQAEFVVEMTPHKTRLARYANVYHVEIKKLERKRDEKDFLVKIKNINP